MTIRTSVTIASIAGAVAALAVIVPVRAGGDKVAFPENHAAGVLFTTVDYAVMEKRAGWGAEYSDNVRNGEWEYQAFKADKSVNTGANLGACFNCHKPLDKQDYVYLYDKMKTAAK